MTKKKAEVVKGKKKPKKLKAPTNEELKDLWYAVEGEGFGYYMLDYGPDLDLIERMGYNREELDAALALLGQLQDEIRDIEMMIVDEEE